MRQLSTSKARADFRIGFASSKQMRAVAGALKPELTHLASDKARASMVVRGRSIKLQFEARDTSTLRAIVSSYLRALAAALNTILWLEGSKVIPRAHRSQTLKHRRAT